MSKVIASVYRIEEEIGSGGGGVVYLAYHLRLDKKVVLKADKRGLSAKPELLRREVDVLKELSHTYIPQVYDFFREGDTVYTVIAFVEGESLDRPLKRGVRFSQPQVIAWAAQLLEALSYLHSPTHGDPPRGYVHSDIKPANLMLTPSGNICLIDFNVALALGEETAIGRSPGYASPEHYGLDYSFSASESELQPPTADVNDSETAADSESQTDTITSTVSLTESLSPPEYHSKGESSKAGTHSKKRVMPDVRSDIYSVGATLYHLLSGSRPAGNAKEVVPLSSEEFSPQLVKIITKAMSPNPDMRYQSADDMLYDLTHLREHDPRVRRLSRTNKIVYVCLLLTVLLGVAATITGLKGMQTIEKQMRLAQYANDAYEQGDTLSALEYSLEAADSNTGIMSILQPELSAQVQSALAQAAGVYDLSDGYKSYKTIELPSEPMCMALSPSGSCAACIYAYELAVIDTESCEVIDTLPVCESALCEVVFADDDTIIYAGSEGLSAYSVSGGAILWTGEPATAVCVSADGSRAAAVYKDETHAAVYNVSDGSVYCTVDFEGRYQRVLADDTYANPHDNLLAINNDASLLAVSFADGSLQVFDLTGSGGKGEILDSSSGYTHFEGGFSGEYFVFSACSSSGSVFQIFEIAEGIFTNVVNSDSFYSVTANENGIYEQQGDKLKSLVPSEDSVFPLAQADADIENFAVYGSYALVSYSGGFSFYDNNAVEIAKFTSEYTADFLCFSGDTALVGSISTPTVRVLKSENHTESEVLSYDSTYEHSEARVSDDGTAVMLFNYEQFRVYSTSGELICECDIPNAGNVYDTQYIRDTDGSYLEITYYDGTVLNYSTYTGELIKEEKGTAPDGSYSETFETDKYTIVSPEHGTPQVYYKGTDELFCELDSEDSLVYAMQEGDYIAAIYYSDDSLGNAHCYGMLLNESCEVIAQLPYLCDLRNSMLYFDYPTGNVRSSRIYNIDEIVRTAQTLKGEIINEQD